MATNTSTRKQTDRYFDLVKQFPLKRIRDDAQLRAAAEIVDTLLKEKLTAAAEDYLDVLTDLIELCEDQHEPISDSSEAALALVQRFPGGLSSGSAAVPSKVTALSVSPASPPI
jgi:antitoxin component HigA of HigAB toxin-antitoxin module